MFAVIAGQVVSPPCMEIPDIGWMTRNEQDQLRASPCLVFSVALLVIVAVLRTVRDLPSAPECDFQVACRFGSSCGSTPIQPTLSMKTKAHWSRRTEPLPGRRQESGIVRAIIAATRRTRRRTR